mgnify:CR=1 FL=1
MTPKNEETYVGLDIGSSRIVCVVGLHQQDSPTPSIIGLGEAPTSGLRRGVVVDIEETVSAITAALEGAERMSGISIERATISVDGSQIQSMNSKGVVAVSRPDHVITKEELARAEQAATAIQLEANRQILQVVTRSYNVDGQEGIVDPVGMNGLKLEVDTHIITGATPAIKNLENAVFRSGIQINNQLIVPLAAARTVLTKKQLEQGVALVHIGSETTGLAIYLEGRLSYSTIFPFGSSNITKDLVYGLRTSMDIAEKIKLKYGVASKPNHRNQEKVDLAQFGGKGIVLKSDVDKIIHARLNEIVSIVSKEITKVDQHKQLSSGVVLTGGGANMPDIADFFKAYVKLPTAIGSSHKYTGVSEKITDPGYSTAIGLMLEDMDIPKEHKSKRFEGILSAVGSKAKALFKSLMP